MTKKTECVWCGSEFEPKAARSYGPLRFCCTDHRQRFNNLAMQRGAELYPLLMANAFERTTSARKSGTIRRAIDRLLSRYRDEDFQARDGRRSWGDWTTFLLNDPTLTMTGTYGAPWSPGRATTEGRKCA